jgi:hypothetical protein
MDALSAISLLVGVIGTAISIYQYALIHESKRRSKELQYLLAAIHSSAIQKQLAWTNQIQLLGNPDTEEKMYKLKTYVRAKDDFSDIAQLTVSLEGAISVDDSAISSMLNRTLENSKKNNELQAEGLKNPSQIK